jgi:Protein of unknown function (DUF2510)
VEGKREDDRREGAGSERQRGHPGPGWYAYEEGEERYWDGGRWTGESRPALNALELALPRLRH